MMNGCLLWLSTYISPHLHDPFLYISLSKNTCSYPFSHILKIFPGNFLQIRLFIPHSRNTVFKSSLYLLRFMTNKNKRSIILITFTAVFLDLMNNCIIVPILPYLVKELNSTSMQEGILFSSYSFFQLISNCLFTFLIYRYFNCWTSE